MKIRWSLLLLMLIPTLLFSQKISPDFTVTTSKPYKVVDAAFKEYMSLDDGTAFMLKKDGDAVFLQKFDTEGMKEVSQKEYTDFPKKCELIELFKVDNNLFYIYSVYNKKAKNFSVFSRPINTDSGEFEEPQELFTTSRKVANNQSFGIVNTVNMNSKGYKFKIHRSFDESKVLIRYRLHPKSRSDKKNFDEIGFHVFDSKLQKIVSKEVTMPYTEAEVNNLAYSVNNEGEAKALLANNTTKEYEWLSVNAAGEPTVTKLGLSTDKMMQTVKMNEKADGGFACAGFYANGIEFKMSFGGGSLVFNVNGLYYFDVSKDGELLNEYAFDFPKEFIKQNLSDRQKKKVEAREKKGKAGIIDLILTDFVIKKDGSAFFIGERQYVAKELYGTSTKYVYHFANMVAMKVSKDGELEWMRKLPKNQAGVNGLGQMSFSYLQGETSDFVVYVDNPKNVNLDPTGGVPVAHKDGLGGFLTAYKIDHASGDLEKHTVADLKDIKGIRAYQFKANRIFKALDKTFLMEVYIKGKKDAMVKFELN